MVVWLAHISSFENERDVMFTIFKNIYIFIHVRYLQLKHSLFIQRPFLPSSAVVSSNVSPATQF